MGCWLNTCAVSHLPIFCGDEVVVVFLSQDKHNELKPIPFYFYGTYDDYGGYENTSGIGKIGITEFLKDSLNKPDSVELTVEDLWEMNREGKLFRTAGLYNTEKNRLFHVQIRKTVFETVVENMKLDHYSGGKTHHLGMRDMYQMVPGLINEISSRPNMIPGFKNKVISYLFSPDYEIFDFLSDISRSDKSGLMEGLIKNAMELAIVGLFLDRVGKPWMQPGHLGQEGDVTYHELLAHMILDAATEIKYDCDYEDDDEETI